MFWKWKKPRIQKGLKEVAIGKKTAFTDKMHAIIRRLDVLFFLLMMSLLSLLSSLVLLLLLLYPDIEFARLDGAHDSSSMLMLDLDLDLALDANPDADSDADT